MRPPWSDPQRAYVADFTRPDASHPVDLNRGFRDFLTTPPFTHDLRRELRRRCDAFERRRALRGSAAWSYYCALRLSALLASRQTAQARYSRVEWLDEYCHYLATGDRWSFTSRHAYPQSVEARGAFAPDSTSDRIRSAFEQYVERCGLIRLARRASQVAIAVEADGEIPFAILLARLLRAQAPGAEVAIVCGDAIDGAVARAVIEDVRPEGLVEVPRSRTGEIEPVLTRNELARAARFFRRSPGRLLSVRWRPAGTGRAGANIHRHLATLRSHQIPVALDFAPQIDREPESGDELFGDVLDRALELQQFVADITVNVRSVRPRRAPLRVALARLARDQALSDLLYVQLVAELDDDRLAPWRVRRKAVGRKTRLQAARAQAVRSPFNVSEMSALLDPDKDGRPYRLGRGYPLAETPAFPRAARASRYLVFVGCPQVIPVARADSAYTDALAYFTSPRAARGFVERYRTDARSQALAFLDLLVHNEILRLA